MTQEEFITSTNNLEDIYNKRLNDAQLGFWFKELQRFEIEKYREAIGQYVKRNKAMPTISDILKEINNLREASEEKSKVTKVPCDTCHRNWSC